MLKWLPPTQLIPCSPRASDTTWVAGTDDHLRPAVRTPGTHVECTTCLLFTKTMWVWYHILNLCFKRMLHSYQRHFLSPFFYLHRVLFCSNSWLPTLTPQPETTHRSSRSSISDYTFNFIIFMLNFLFNFNITLIIFFSKYLKPFWIFFFGLLFTHWYLQQVHRAIQKMSVLYGDHSAAYHVMPHPTMHLHLNFVLLSQVIQKSSWAVGWRISSCTADNN